MKLLPGEKAKKIDTTSPEIQILHDFDPSTTNPDEEGGKSKIISWNCNKLRFWVILYPYEKEMKMKKKKKRTMEVVVNVFSVDNNEHNE